MPGINTHYFFGQKVISDLSDEVFSPITKYPRCYNLGLQGPDLFFFNPESYLFYDGNIGNKMHTSNVKAMFAAMCAERDKFKKSYDRAICDAYILGFIGHYVLDSLVHPYVYYRTKSLDHPDREAYDFGIHVFLETDMNSAVLRHYEHKKPNEFHAWTVVRLIPHEEVVLCRLLHRSINRVFPSMNFRASTIQSAFRTIRITQWLLHDPTGMKKMLVRFIEDKFAGYAIVSSMLPSNTIQRYKDPCNTAHHAWANPWAPDQKSNKDVYELMDDGVSRMSEIMKLYKDAFQDKPHERGDDHQDRIDALLNALGNNSYDSGLPL